jgi:hypothetical protein
LTEGHEGKIEGERCLISVQTIGQGLNTLRAGRDKPAKEDYHPGQQGDDDQNFHVSAFRT